MRPTRARDLKTIPNVRTVGSTPLIRSRIVGTVLLTWLVPTMIFAGAVRSVHRADLTQAIGALIDRDLPAWLRFYEDLHAHPELSLQEAQSAAKVAAEFERAGYSVTRGVGGHGVVGVLVNGSGPTVLIRGDMDALPVLEETGLPYASRVTAEAADGRHVGVMHACGHDVHQTVLVAVAKVLAELRDQWRGTALLVAQPAEEIGKGALAMINDGLFERFLKPDYCLALHVSATLPVGDVGYTSGWSLANVDSVDVTIFGRGGHGSRPHEAVDPIVTAALTVTALQTIVSRRNDPTEPAVITVGSLHAGSKHNIIPDDAQLQITVRSYTETTRRLLLDGIREVTTQTCRAMGCPRDPEVFVRDDEFTPATFNDPELTEATAAVFREVFGPEHVKIEKPQMGGEDFGRYAKHAGVPGFMFWLGSVKREQFDASKQPGGPRLPSIHSARYTPDPVPTLSTGVRSMSAAAFSLFERADR